MHELRHLVALSVPPGSRVLAVGPDISLLEGLADRTCRTWSVLGEDSPPAPVRAVSEGVVVADLDRLDLAGAFAGIEFDMVVLMGSLAQVLSPGSLLRSVVKVLGADGRVVASVPNATDASRRVRVWQGTAEDDEAAGPGRPFLRAFNLGQIGDLLRESGLMAVDTLRVRRSSTAPRPPTMPPAVLAFLEGDVDADVDHYVLIASPTARQGTASPSLAEALQQRLRDVEQEAARLQADLATIEHEMETLQLDLAVKDDFALELVGKLRAAEHTAAVATSDLAEAQSSLAGARQQLEEQGRQIEELRRGAGTTNGAMPKRRIGARRRSSGTAGPPA